MTPTRNNRWLRNCCLILAITFLGLSSVRISQVNDEGVAKVSKNKADLESHSGGSEKAHYSTVTIVGAGAAGLGAAQALRTDGVNDIKILEASQVLGGRMRADRSFLSDGWPLDLGASFVGDYEGMVRPLVGNTSGTYFDFALPEGTDLYVFVNYTWYDFFADYIAPPKESDTIVYGCVVDSINYEGSMVKVSCTCGEGEHQERRTYISNYTIVTVSLQMLRDETIKFTPSGPVAEIVKKHPGEMWDGFKIFFEFAEKFWNESCCFKDDIEACETEEGETLFWEYPVIHKNDSKLDTYIYTGYVMGKPLRPYVGLDESILVQKLLRRLDDEFGGKEVAAGSYLRHMLVNWTDQPFIRGILASAPYKDGVQNVHNKVFVAGEAFPLRDSKQGWVHAAFYSGEDAADEILDLMESSYESESNDTNEASRHGERR